MAGSPNASCERLAGPKRRAVHRAASRAAAAAAPFQKHPPTPWPNIINVALTMI